MEAYKGLTPPATPDFVSSVITYCDPNKNFIATFTLHTPSINILPLSSQALKLGRQTAEKNRPTDTQAGSVLCLAHSFISSLGVCEAWQPISARTPEATLISSHRSCLCAVCSSAKECQVRLLWPSAGLILSHPLTNPLRIAEAGRPVAATPPSGTESHTGLIHLASGNRHLSLRMPPGTHRQGLI